MKNWLFLGACGALVAAQACGSSNGSGGSGTNSTSTSTGTSSGASTSTGTSSGASTSTSTGTSSGASTSSGGTGGAGTGSSTSSGSGAGGGAPCAHEGGAYAIAETGTGCGTLDITAQQCIKPSMTTLCTFNLVSKAGVTSTGVDGTVPLDLAGDFTGAALTLGSTAETGCSGTWNATTSALTVVCGTCSVTLTRTSHTCGF